MVDFPNAKINLGLNIVSKRRDGFHDIESIFLPVPWFDILEIIPHPDGVKFTSTGIEIPGDLNTNLCIQAFELLRADFDIPPVHIHLHKNIPIGAGLGGGSSDCAFTLKMINQLFELHIDQNRLENYALQLGSDCPFFVGNAPSYVTGTGDILTPITLDLSNYYIALVNPGIHISTKEAYSGVSPVSSTSKLFENIENIELWKSTIKNDFESHLFGSYPVLDVIKKEMYDLGAVYSAMTGSGSTIFGIFKDKPENSQFHLNKSSQLVVRPFDIHK